MSDIVSIELLLDPDTEALVREDWERLAHEGLAARRSPRSRPHITLLVRPSLDAMTFTEASALLPIGVTLAGPIVFRHRDRAVLARRVVPTEELLQLHRAVHSAAPPGMDAAHTLPGDWTPHVTLARRMHLDVLPDALRVIGADQTGRGVGLRRWDSATATVTSL
jgi:2'-5' RNA ligase